MDNQQITITVEATVDAALGKVWTCWTLPQHITQWNHAADSWHTPHATNDLLIGGHFLWRMEARDGSFGFDFSGVFDEIKLNELIAYTLDDGRKVKISFTTSGNQTKIVEIFEPEDENTVELQQAGWQAILDNFKKYVEAGS